MLHRFNVSVGGQSGIREVNIAKYNTLPDLVGIYKFWLSPSKIMFMTIWNERKLFVGHGCRTGLCKMLIGSYHKTSTHQFLDCEGTVLWSTFVVGKARVRN